MDQIVEKLATIPLLANLTDEQRQRLTRACECIFVAPGKTLIAQGEIADAAYLCLDDTLLRECVSDAAEPADVTSVPADTVILELAMIVETEAAASFVAEGHARVLKISREKVLSILETDPGLARIMSDTLRERLTEVARTMRETIASFDQPAEAIEADQPADANEAISEPASDVIKEEERRSA